MIPKAFASLRIRQPADEAIYKILLINRLVGFAEPFGFHKGRSQ
jgi:hypothetical protein